MAFSNSSFQIRRPYQVNRSKAVQLVTAGFVGTLAMVVVAYLLRALAFPAPDFGAIYGSIMNGREVPAAFSAAWWLGLAWHFITGALIFPFIMDYLLNRNRMISSRWVKGIAFGAVLWLLMEAVVRPIAGDGFFSNNLPSPLLASLLALICWAVYGATLDGMERVRIIDRKDQFPPYEREAA